jgi:CO/xanthine dehydrogenase Mo-binding subunit
VPRFLDLPARFSCVFVENGAGAGPFGAKGAGSLTPVSPALGNALARLTGVRFRYPPFTPVRVAHAPRPPNPLILPSIRCQSHSG